MGFWPELFFQNTCFFSNKSHRLYHRGPFIGRKECIWDLLLQIDDFPTSILGGKPLWGHDFLNFLIPKKCPHYGRFSGVEKNFIRHFEVCGHIELEVCKWSSLQTQVLDITTKSWILKIRFGSKTTLRVKFFGFFTSKKLPP